jgi:hypothetical protein
MPLFSPPVCGINVGTLDFVFTGLGVLLGAAVDVGVIEG